MSAGEASLKDLHSGRSDPGRDSVADCAPNRAGPRRPLPLSVAAIHRRRNGKASQCARIGRPDNAWGGPHRAVRMV
jgi:hypothetical protein